tara:strand:- start:63 stop:224 length:162 start_codon:yes stop_codon:yes gene_type:complete
MSEKGWWEEEGVPEVGDPFQEDEGGAVGNLVAIVLRTLAVIIIFYISIQVEYL